MSSEELRVLTGTEATESPQGDTNAEWYEDIEFEDPAVIPPYTHLGQGLSGQAMSESVSYVNEHSNGSTLTVTTPNLKLSHSLTWRRISTFWSDSWTAQVLSCVLASISLACLIAVLRTYNGRVLKDLPIKISINTLVSIITAVIKSSLLMPVADGENPKG